MELPRTTASAARHRLTASNVARYFKHKCDRLFRWDAVESQHRTRAGIGWNVVSGIEALLHVRGTPASRT